jgi:hypothetical protein
MPIETVLTMVIILGIVWGGFTTILSVALRKERRKRAAADES